jgi:hypothetical protein
MNRMALMTTNTSVTLPDVKCIKLYRHSNRAVSKVIGILKSCSRCGAFARTLSARVILLGYILRDLKSGLKESVFTLLSTQGKVKAKLGDIGIPIRLLFDLNESKFYVKGVSK